MVECFKLALISAIIGYVYALVLVQPGEALGWLFSFLKKRLTKKEIVEGAEIPEELKGLSVRSEKIVYHEHWLLKPLGACEKCVSGQIAMWLFLRQSIIGHYYLNNDTIFVIINHIFTICLSILLTLILKKLLLRL